MQAAECRSTLAQLFEREQHTLDALDRVLEAEFRALQAQDTTALEQAAADKAARMQALETLEHTLADLLRRAGYAHDRDGIEACMDWCDSNGGLREHWQTLLQSLQRCQEHNRNNGVAIEAHRRHTHTALAVLRGQSPHPATYASSGRTDSGDGGTRTLAKA